MPNSEHEAMRIIVTHGRHAQQHMVDLVQAAIRENAPVVQIEQLERVKRQVDRLARN